MKQKFRSQASTDESDSESENCYAIDEGDIILECVVDHNKLDLGESDVQLNAESQALAVDKDTTDYDWWALWHPSIPLTNPLTNPLTIPLTIPLTTPPTTNFVYTLSANNKQVGVVDG